MDFGYDDRTEEFRKRLLAFMDECVYPAEPVFAAQVRDNTAGRTRVGAPRGDRGTEGGGPRARPVEPLPGPSPGGRGAHQPPVRAPGGDHRAQPGACPRGAQLRRAGHREHGTAGRVRFTRAAGTLAPAAAGRDDPVGLLHDRAGRRVLGCRPTSPPGSSGTATSTSSPAGSGGRRRDEPGLRALHRDGPDRLGRGPAPPAVDDPGAPGHPGVTFGAGMQPVRLRRRAARRPRRGRVRRRPGARGQPDRRRGRRLRDRAGPAGPGPDPPLHAARSVAPSGPWSCSAAGSPTGSRSASPWPTRG